jgi:hypothetical protein
MSRAVASLLLLLVVAACAATQPVAPVGSVLVPIPTQGPPPTDALDGCRMARLEGVLVRHQEVGLAVRSDPAFAPVIALWPHGWVARDVGGVRQLLDDRGRVMAREGDRVVSAGGSVGDRFATCGDLEVAPGG